MQNTIIFLLIVLIWSFVLMFFKNSKMYFFKFLAGSVGIFTISMIFLLPVFERLLNILITNTLSTIGESVNYFEVFKENSIISIDTKNGIISMLINYECSGVIESLVFTSLALFFPFGGTLRKILSILIGNIYIFIANIIRIIFIVLILKAFGAQSFHLVHTLLARILFFALTILLYYYVFTSTHLKYQRVGDMK